MYKLVDLDPVMVDLVLFGDLEFDSHIERQITSKNEEIVIFESESDCKKFHKEYNELYYK